MARELVNKQRAAPPQASALKIIAPTTPPAWNAASKKPAAPVPAAESASTPRTSVPANTSPAHVRVRATSR